MLLIIDGDGPPFGKGLPTCKIKTRMQMPKTA